MSYNPNPTASFTLDHKSAFFKDLPITCSKDTEELILRINGACSFIERYCNRRFAKANYSEIQTVKQSGSIILDNAPVSSINRVAYSNGGWFNVANATAWSPNYSTGVGFITLSQYVSGVLTSQTFEYTDYPMISQLASAINVYGQGWNAWVTSGNTPTGFPNDQLPSSDIVAYQNGTANLYTSVLMWQPYESLLAPAIWPTTEYYSPSYDVSSGILDWFFPRGIRLRLDYTGGFNPIPPEIEYVTARLVLEASRKKSESLGDYSFSMEDISSLPNSDKRILGYYRNRGC